MFKLVPEVAGRLLQMNDRLTLNFCYSNENSDVQQNFNIAAAYFMNLIH